MSNWSPDTLLLMMRRNVPASNRPRRVGGAELESPNRRRRLVPFRTLERWEQNCQSRTKKVKKYLIGSLRTELLIVVISEVSISLMTANLA